MPRIQNKRAQHAPPGRSTPWRRKVMDVLRHGLLIQTLLDGLRRAGIEITPYYIMREHVVAPGQAPAPAAEGTRLAWLTPADAGSVGDLPDSKFTAAETRDRLARGQRCLAVWIGEELAAFMWIDTRELDFDPCRMALARNEAYLFGATTTRAWRGRNLVPHLRAELYRMLLSEGRTLCYSVSYAFNTPAIRFKRKLNAEFDRLYLYVGLGGRYRRNWLLRDYRNSGGGT